MLFLTNLLNGLFYPEPRHLYFLGGRCKNLPYQVDSLPDLDRRALAMEQAECLLAPIPPLMRDIDTQLRDKV